MKIICISDIERIGGMGFRHSDVTIGKIYDCISVEEIIPIDGQYSTYKRYKIETDEGRILSKPEDLFETMENRRDNKLCQLDII